MHRIRHFGTGKERKINTEMIMWPVHFLKRNFNNNRPWIEAMQKLVCYIKLNLLPTITVVFLTALIFSFGIIPYISIKFDDYYFLKGDGEDIRSTFTLAYIAFFLIFYILSWNTCRRNWSKYKRTYELELTSF